MGRRRPVPSGYGARPGHREHHGLAPHRSRPEKVEEHNFDIRKNLLEYDEVMDYQRKCVYGRRQEMLNDANPKVRIWSMLNQQIDLALDRYLDPSYGAASFAEVWFRSR